MTDNNDIILSFDDGILILIDNALQISVPDDYHYCMDGIGENDGWVYIVPKESSLNKNHIDAKPLSSAISRESVSTNIRFEAGIS